MAPFVPLGQQVVHRPDTIEHLTSSGFLSRCVVYCHDRGCDSAATVRSDEQEPMVANSGESQQQCLQRLCQSWQRNQAWSGRRERATGIEPAFSAWEAEC